MSLLPPGDDPGEASPRADRLQSHHGWREGDPSLSLQHLNIECCF